MSNSPTNQKPPPGTGWRQLPPEEIYARLSEVRLAQWLDILLGSLSERQWNGVNLPTFPPPHLQAAFVGTSNEAALRNAYDFYLHVQNELTLHAKPLGRESTVLDFGCGWGRIMRFFLRDVPWPQLFGFDPWSEAIQLCRSTEVYGQFLKTNLLPPCLVKDETFDLIYAYSVFSHLSEKAAGAWIAELSRLLKPGGLLIITTRGQNYCHYLRTLRAKDAPSREEQHVLSRSPDSDALEKALSAGEFFFFAPPDATKELGKELYGHAAVPAGYISKHWTDKAGLSLDNFADSPSHLQAIATLRKLHRVPLP